MTDLDHKARVLNEADDPPEADAPQLRLKASPREFTAWQRVQLFFITWAGYLAMLFISLSLRWEVVGWGHYEAAQRLGKGVAFNCWHNAIFANSCFWRKRGLVVMASQGFDGEYIARVLEKHGYGAARGSSSRGGGRALVELIRCLRHGLGTVLTVDGPRGPRFVVKPGTIQLAKVTGAPIVCFHGTVRHAWVSKRSWDRTEIPYPFSRGIMVISPAIFVPRDADRAEEARKLEQVQAAMDDVRIRGERWLRGEL